MVGKKLGPSDEAKSSRDFYAKIDPQMEVGFFSSMWHIVSMGHLVSTDLDRIARGHDLSIADLLLLGTLRIISPHRMRPTDLAFKLHVSNAALSSRIVRLVGKGLIERIPCDQDKRSFEVALTPAGARKADTAIADISRNGQFASRYAQLPEQDREEMERVLGKLHDLIDRDFLPGTLPR